MTEPDDADKARRARVFLSYSRKDVAFVDRLAEAMRARGHDVLLDREDISGGEAWKERLDQLLLQADAVAFIMSPDSVLSAICDWETQRTIELGKRLIPLFWRPLEQQPPSQLARLNYIFMDADEKFDQGVAQLSLACDVDISWVRDHTRFTDLAARWDSSGRRVDALLRGEELTAAENWLAARPPLAPEVPEALMAFLQSARAEATSDLLRERKRLQRMRTLQLGIGGLVSLAAVIVMIGGLGTARLMSGLGAQRSITLARLSVVASDAGHFDRAARYAAAGILGSDRWLIGFDGAASESALRRALAGMQSIVAFRGHAGTVSSAALSADGRFVVTGSDDHTARLWSVESGRTLAVLEGHAGPVNEAAFSPDGRLVATGSADGTARLWSIPSGREIALLYVGAPVWRVAFSRDGERMVTASRDGVGRVWTKEGQQISSLRGHTDNLVFADISSDGSRIVTSSFDGTARIWDAATGAQVAVLRGHEGIVVTARFDPSGTRIVTASRDQTVRVWDLDGREMRNLSGHTAPVISAMFSPDGARVVSASRDTTARLWDTSSGAELAVLEHTSVVTSAIFNPDGSFILTASEDGVARIWDGTQGTAVNALRGHDSAITSATFSADGDLILTGSRDNTARLWNASRQNSVVRGHNEGVSGVLFTRDGRRFLTASHDGLAHVWDTATGSQLATLRGHQNYLTSVSIDTDQRRIVTASADGTARVWDLRSGRQLALIMSDEFGFGPRTADFSADGAQVVTASSRLHVWNAETGELLRSLDEHEGNLVGYRYAEGRGTVVRQQLDHSLHVWTAASELPRVLIGHTDQVMSAAFNSDGSLIVTASRDGSARIWDAQSGTEIAVLNNDDSLDNAVFDPRARHVLTVSTAGIARIWDVATAFEIMTIRREGLAISSAAFDHRGENIIVGRWDGYAEVVPLSPALSSSRQELLRHTCRTLRPGLSGFYSSELEAAPALDPSFDADPCVAPPLSRQLGAYFGDRPIAGSPSPHRD